MEKCKEKCDRCGREDFLSEDPYLENKKSCKLCQLKMELIANSHCDLMIGDWNGKGV